MNRVYRSSFDPHLWFLDGTGTISFSWGEFQPIGWQYASHWLTVQRTGNNRLGELPVIDLGGHVPDPGPDRDYRLEDRVTFDVNGIQRVTIRDVEYVDSSLPTETHLRHTGHYGFASDGSLESIRADVGNHEMHFTTAIKDSSLFLGDGFDIVNLEDHLDLPGEQYWSLIRRDGNMLDAYSLITGQRIRMEGGLESLTGNSGVRNYGEIEQIIAEVADPSDPDAPTVVFNPGGGDLPNPGDRGIPSNIDLRTVEMVDPGTGYVATAQAFSDSFNLAYFNFIRYTSDNVWVGEATVHDGTIYSTPSDRTVDDAKNVYQKSGYTVDAPVLDGQLSVIGQSRNGTHDLIVAEQATAIDGKLRLYTFDVASELYNEFNEVFLGTSANEASDKSSIGGSDWSDRVALYGFGGEDVLKGGAGRDYIFGGQSVYNQLNAGAGETGNQVTGGTGADYFGVGNTNSFGAVSGANTTIGTQSTTGAFHQGYATDVIMDWHAGQDTVVVLSNGVAVVAGLRDGGGVVSLTGSNTIDFRDYAAIATSDQDFDGARGGDNWDQTQSLDYIYNNQTTRDANSIANEADRTVVNNGLIVARGLNGNDTLHDSAGADYLYGNKGADLISLAEGGADRVYIDTFDSSLVRSNSASIYVASFDGAGDQVFVNKGVIDAFNSAGSGRALAAVDVSGTYRQAVKYDANINFLHDSFYSPAIYDTNDNHRNNDGAGAFGDNSGSDRTKPFSGADGTTFGIGAGMVGAGFALLFVPFMGGVGAALIASGTALGAGTAVFPTTEHENATFDGDVSNYLNVITSSTLETVTTTAATATAKNSDNVRFLDFFGGSNAGDGFVPVVEFTANAGQGIYGYFALHSAGGDNETFVYLVASSDNLVENSEAIKVAEINGHLTADDFKVYDGEADIYNVGSEPQIVLRTPVITFVKDANNDFGIQRDGIAVNNDKLIEKGGTPDPNNLTIDVELSGARVAGTTIKIYDGSTLIFDGDENSASENSGGEVSVAYNSSTNTFTVTDARSIGTVAIDSQVDPVTYQRANPLVINGKDNNFVLRDSIVNYSIELIDGETGISTRANSGAITVSGGNNPIDGGTEITTTGDILNITGTNDYINSTADENIVEIETIMLSAVDTNGTGNDDTSGGPGPDGKPAIEDTDDAPILDLSNQSDGFIVNGSTIGDKITGSTGDDTINGLGGADEINLGSGGNDRVEFNYSTDGDDADSLADRLGVDTGFDTITGMNAGDEIFVSASADLDTDNDSATPLETVQGFDDRDGDANRLMYETSTTGSNMRVASATELLVVSNSTVSASGDLTNNIAAALDSAFDVSGLDGRSPSASTGGGTNSSLLFAVKSNETNTYWVGRYEDQGDDDVISGNTDIEVFAKVATSDILNSFWLDTELAPQQLTITLPADTGPTEATGTLYTTNNTFTVGDLQDGNSVYYSLNGGSTWSTAPANQTTISLNANASNDIRVRQVDGTNYSPETTVGSQTVVYDTIRPGVSLAINDSSLADNDTNGIVTITFTEPVSGFTVSDLSDSAGVLSFSSFSGNGANYSATYTVTDSVAGSTQIQIGNNSYEDRAGIDGSGGSSGSISYDRINPTVSSISGIPDTVNSGASGSFTVSFSESVTGFGTEDVTAPNLTIDSVSGTGASYTVNYSNATTTSGATKSVSIGAGYTDLVGNSGTAGTGESYVVASPPTPVFFWDDDEATDPFGTISSSNHGTSYAASYVSLGEFSTSTAAGTTHYVNVNDNDIMFDFDPNGDISNITVNYVRLYALAAGASTGTLQPQLDWSVDGDNWVLAVDDLPDGETQSGAEHRLDISLTITDTAGTWTWSEILYIDWA